MKTFPLILLALLLMGCPPQPVTPQPPTPGPTPEVRDTDQCAAAQENLKRLDCKNPNGTLMWVNADGEPFATTCQRLQEQATVFINPACIATATTCKEADACPPSSK